jgi:hypothetical protein
MFNYTINFLFCISKDRKISISTEEIRTFLFPIGNLLSGRP